MITPSPTTPIDPAIARGTLVPSPGTALREAFIRFAIPNTSYELHLIPTAAITTPPGKPLLGFVRVDARKIEVVGTGGRYVEPVMGRPRRVQGSVIRHEGDTVVVDAGGFPMHLRMTDSRQNQTVFTAGLLVSCDVLDGATFTPKQSGSGA